MVDWVYSSPLHVSMCLPWSHCERSLFPYFLIFKLEFVTCVIQWHVAGTANVPFWTLNFKSPCMLTLLFLCHFQKKIPQLSCRSQGKNEKLLKWCHSHFTAGSIAALPNPQTCCGEHLHLAKPKLNHTDMWAIENEYKYKLLNLGCFVTYDITVLQRNRINRI